MAPVNGNGPPRKRLKDYGLRSERLLMRKPEEPAVIEEELGNLEEKLLLTTVEKAVAWAQGYSIWPATFGLACCAIEMMSLVTSRYDSARFGAEVFRSTPRQADLLIVSGRVAHKMAAPLRQIYDQMLEPLGWFGFWELAFFIGILALAYVYIWRKGALEWRL